MIRHSPLQVPLSNKTVRHSLLEELLLNGMDGHSSIKVIYVQLHGQTFSSSGNFVQ